MSLPRFLPFAAGLSLIAAPAFAATDANGVVTISPQEREAAIAAAAAGRTAQGELPINGLDRGVHGEVGVEIGTGGRRAMFGTAVMPIGETGYAAISVATGSMGRQRLR